MARAKAVAWSGVRIGERRAPALNGPARNPASSSIATRMGLRCVAGSNRVDQIEMCDIVDHQRDVRRGEGILGQLGDGRPLYGRVPEYQITEALAVQPQRLRQGVAEQAREAGYGQRFGKYLAHADAIWTPT